MLLVDAANVVGSRPTGWWRDRAGAARAFVERLRAATAAGLVTPTVVVVLEGAARQGVAEGTVGGVEVIHAAGEGDDTIASLAAAAAADGHQVTLVSADRALGERVRRGGPRWSAPAGSSTAWTTSTRPRPDCAGNPLSPALHLNRHVHK